MNVFHIFLLIVIAMVIGIIALFVYLMILAARWADTSHRNTFISAVVLVMVAVGIYSGYRYETRYSDPYYFWKELQAKNSKPFWVSQTKYEEKNRQGYCWRDRKYYSKDELLAKAKRSFIQLLQADAVEMQEGRIMGTSGNYLESSITDCKYDKGICRVHVISKEINLTDFNISDSNTLRLTKELKSYELESYTADNKYIKSVVNNKNIKYIIFPIGFDNISAIYTNDCCSVVNKSDFSKIKNRYLNDKENYYTSDGFGYYMFFGKHFIPDRNTNLNNGIGNYYFVTQSVSISFENKELSGAENVWRIAYSMNNCGDILHMPTYYISKF